jgi:hypothetical protein
MFGLGLALRAMWGVQALDTGWPCKCSYCHAVVTSVVKDWLHSTREYQESRTWRAADRQRYGY